MVRNGRASASVKFEIGRDALAAAESSATVQLASGLHGVR
jgi:hypothetical protein